MVKRRVRKRKRQQPGVLTIGAEQFFPLAATARTLDREVVTLRRWIREGRLGGHKIGGSLWVAESDLRAFIAAGRVEAQR